MVKQLREALKGVRGDREIIMLGPYCSSGEITEVVTEPGDNERAAGYSGRKQIFFYTDLFTG